MRPCTATTVRGLLVASPFTTSSAPGPEANAPEARSGATGATLRLVKVIDRDAYQRQGGEAGPWLEQQVRLPEPPPATAAPFVVLRGWVDIADGGGQETWRIESRDGRQVCAGLPTTLQGDERTLASEVPDARFDHADDRYQLVIELDGWEVARHDFPVLVDDRGGRLAT